MHVHDLAGGDGEVNRASVAGQVGGDDEGVVIDLFDPARCGLMTGCSAVVQDCRTWSRPVQSKGPGVLINEGDGGGIGTAAQIAKWFGADVTGECSTVT